MKTEFDKWLEQVKGRLAEIKSACNNVEFANHALIDLNKAVMIIEELAEQIGTYEVLDGLDINRISTMTDEEIWKQN